MSWRHAFSLSKEEVHDATPPGTIALIDTELVRSRTGGHEYSEKHVHLQPEPSMDPADPLNFPMWRKLTILALMALYAAVANISSAILSSALPNIVTAFATFSPEGPPTGIVPFADTVHLIAVNVIMLGAANIWWVPLSNAFGRRPIILICVAMLCGFSVWCAEASSFNNLLAARVFQGIGGAAADTLAPDIVGRVFFVHQRGRAMAIYTIFLLSGSLIGGLIGGYVANDLGWRWTMWLCAILSGGIFAGCAVLLPEVLFDREGARQVTHEGEASSVSEKNQATVESAEIHVYEPYTFRRSLGFAKRRPGSILQRFYLPYRTLALPGALVVMLQYAGLVGLIVTMSSLAPLLLAAPPYLWGANVGLINIAGLIGSILGVIYTFFTTDWLIKRAASRDSRGFAEPEERLPLMFPPLIIATLGALVFGFCAQNPSPHGWVGLSFGLGMVCFGIMQVPSVGFNYIIEAYGEWASDCFLMVVSLRAIIGFAWTFFVGTWAAENGPAEPFGIFAMLMGLFGLTVLPLWLFGKRMRIATQGLVAKKPAM